MRLSQRGALAALDARSAWLAPLASDLAPTVAAMLRGATVADALQSTVAGLKPWPAVSAGPLQFVDSVQLPPGEAYEAFVARTANVPTRDNLHDLFNGLVWLRFPQAKRRLNELQAAEIARHGVGATRGALRDALTLFDENGAVLDAPPALWDALVARDWHRLFVAERALWDEARLLVLGHALLEKLMSPRKAMTAHVLYASGASRSIAPDDREIAAALEPAHLSTKPFVPLPVLGVPGWSAANKGPGFYDDEKVFRPKGP